MDLIEQYIRKIILERDKTDVTTPSGYQIKILSSYYGDSDVERLRSKLVNDRAQENGCIQGFMIVAKKKNEKGDDSKLIDDVIDAMRMNKTLMQYYDKDFRIIMSEPRKIGKRKKVFAVWILDMRESSRFKQLLNRIDQVFSNPDAIRISIPKDAKSYILKFLAQDGTSVIQQRDAITWIDSVNGFLSDLKTNDTYTYNQILNPKDKFSVRLLSSIPDFNKMLLGVNVDDETDASTYKQVVTIDDEWVKNNFKINFRGTATVLASPITGEETVIPKEGSLYYSVGTGADPFYTGTFDDDGKPNDGNYIFGGPVGPTVKGDPSSYTGKLTTNLAPLLDAMGFDTGDKRITWSFIKGTLFYWHPKDPKYMYFEGTFKEKSPLNGNIYSRKTTEKVIAGKGDVQQIEITRSEYELIGKVTGGKTKYYGKNITLPYTFDNTIYYQDPKNADSVYGYFDEIGRWIQVPKQTFVDYAIDKEISAEVYAKSVVPIVDPDLCSGLCKTFNVTDEFLTIKPNSNNYANLYVKTTKAGVTKFEKPSSYKFAGDNVQYRRRIKYLNEVVSGYKKVSVLTNLEYDTTTAKFKYTELAKTPAGDDLWISQTDLN